MSPPAKKKKNVRDASPRKKLKNSRIKKPTLQQVAVGRDRRQQRQEDERLERQHFDFLWEVWSREMEK
jgi:hypothetical protein